MTRYRRGRRLASKREGLRDDRRRCQWPDATAASTEAVKPCAGSGWGKEKGRFPESWERPSGSELKINIQTVGYEYHEPSRGDK